ncbi:MAG: trypsin-like peptidase domain-containing protein [Clostridia bacterium]|nr:trypsin-like peptidase domain-containing protein [Clostridia bacterium]
MKITKILKMAAVSLIAALTAFGSAACDFSESKSAYDIAVENGSFVGTEEEWLLSLKGKDGEDAKSPTIEEIYEAWLGQGNEGSFNDFLKEYLNVNVSETNDTDTIAKNVMSVVSVYCAFDYQLEYKVGYYVTETLNYKKNAAGSGVVYWLDKENGNALVITNYHVVYGAASLDENHISDEIWLYPYGGLMSFTRTSYKTLTVNNEEKDYTTGVDGGAGGIRATYIGGSMTYDVAVLEVSGSSVLRESEMVAAEIGDSNTVRVGEKVYAIGNPEGDGISVSEGVLSVDSEYISMTGADTVTELDFRVMRTDAAINHGNSGGALFDSQGKLIGIPSAKNVEKDVENMGYALPINQVMNVVGNLKANGLKVKRATLGVKIGTTDSKAVWDEQSKRLKIVEEIAISSVDVRSVADVCGLEANDVLVSAQVNGGETVAIERRYHVIDLMLTIREGDTLTLKVLRKGIEKTVTITFYSDYFNEIA